MVQGYEAEAEGGISIRIHSPPVASFDRSYFALKPDNATLSRNPWFSEFWEHRFNCSFARHSPSSVASALVGHGNGSAPLSSRICTGRS